jgi:hypothetical protein
MKRVQHLQCIVALGSAAGPALAITDGVTSQGLGMSPAASPTTSGMRFANSGRTSSRS